MDTSLRPPTIPYYPSHLSDPELAQERLLADHKAPSTPPRAITPVTRQPSDEEAKSSPEGSPPKFTATDLTTQLETYTPSVRDKEKETALHPLDFYRIAQAYQQSGDSKRYELFLKAALASKKTSLAFPDRVTQAKKNAETELKASSGLFNLPPGKQKTALKTAHTEAWKILFDVRQAEYARNRAALARKPTQEEQRESHYSSIVRCFSKPMCVTAIESSAASTYPLLMRCLSHYCVEKKAGYAGSDLFPYYLSEVTNGGITTISTVIVNADRLNQQIERAWQDPKACPLSRFTPQQSAVFHANTVAILRTFIQVACKETTWSTVHKTFLLLTVLPELGMRGAGSEQLPAKNPRTGQLICAHNGRLSYYLSLTPSELERVLLPRLSNPEGILYRFVEANRNGADYFERDNQYFYGQGDPIQGVSEATIDQASSLREVATETIDSLKTNIRKASTLTGIHTSWKQPNGHYQSGAYASLPKNSRDTLCVHETDPWTKSVEIADYYSVINIKTFFRSPLTIDLASHIEKMGRERVVDAIVHQLANNRNTLVTLWLILYKLHHRDVDIHPTNNFGREFFSKVWKMDSAALHQSARDTLNSLIDSKTAATQMLNEH